MKTRFFQKRAAGVHDPCDDLFGSVCRPGPRRGILPRHRDQPSRPRLRGGAVFEHGIGDGPRRQQAVGRDQAR